MALGVVLRRNAGRYRSLHDRERVSDHKKWAIRMLNNTLDELSLKDLRAICKDFNLPLYGSKAQVAKRIQKNLLYETFTFEKYGKTIKIKDYRFDFIFEKIKMENDFYEHELLDKIKKVVNPKGIAIDVGGHVGNHTTYFLKICNLKKSYVFEPRAPLARLIIDNAKLNKIEDRVVLNKEDFSALSSASGTAKFEKRKNYNLGTGKLINEPGNINVSTLDKMFSDIKEKVSVLKIDVEGLEREVLKGGKKLIDTHRPVISIESLVKSSNQKDHDEARKILLDILGNDRYKLYYAFGALPGPYTYIFDPIL